MNGRPSTAPVISYAIREACPRARAEARPATILFIDLPPEQVDVNVHPAKRAVRFRRPADVREALIGAISAALTPPSTLNTTNTPAAPITSPLSNAPSTPQSPTVPKSLAPTPPPFAVPFSNPPLPIQQSLPTPTPPQATPTTLWRWFTVLAETATGYLLLETDRGIVTLNPRAARERIAFERLLARRTAISQPLLLPETVHLPPSDSARIRTFLAELESMGFAIEEFGRDVWKLDAVPDLAAGLAVQDLLAAIAADIAEAGAKRGGTRWRDELVARSLARSYAGANVKLTREGASKLVEELAATSQPYICPRGKPIMIFTANSELSRKFDN